jgi:hypothetical protein
VASILTFHCFIAMRTIPSRILPSFAVFCTLAFMPLAPAGPWDNFIANIQAYIGTTEDQTSPNLECPLEEKSRDSICKGLELLRPLNRDQHRQAVNLVRGICNELFAIKKLPGYLETYPQAVELFKSIAWDTGFAAVGIYIALQEKARAYFTDQYDADPTSIRFKPKVPGDQLGTIMTLTCGGQEISYYIKTHHGGLKNDYLIDTQAVDPYELFVYSFLEISCYGSEVHFFWDDAEDFYIATKGVGCPDDEHPNPRPVYTYQQLQDEHTDLLYEEDDGHRYVSPVVMEAWVSADIIARILGLSDLVNNLGNICFTCGEDGQLDGFKIIDFIAPKQRRDDRYGPQSLYGSFASGCGDYRGAPETALYFLRKRTREKRLAYARDLFTVAEFIGWIDEAEAKVTPLMEALNQTELDREGGMPIDLERFHDRVAKARENAEVFLRAIGAAE